MSVGYPASKNDIDSRAGSLCVQLRNCLGDIETFNAFLVATGSQNLQGSGLLNRGGG